MQEKYKSLFSMVTQKPNENLTSQNVKCPYCESRKHTSYGGYSTLVGGILANHHWNEMRCQKCNEYFTLETMGNNRWVADKNKKITDGMPSCFEYYVYTCKKCGGDVKRKHTDFEGKEVTGLHYNSIEGVTTPQFKTFFECDGCKEKIETDYEYWSDRY